MAVAVIVAVPLAAGIAVYYRYITSWFFTDDFLWLEAAKNPNFLDSVKEAFTFPRGATPYWRPLVDLYFFSMYRVVGLRASAYHIANLVLHISNGVLLGFLLLRLSRSVFASCLAAALFVVSPTYVAMVPWASGVTALLSGVFAMLTLLLFVKALQEDRGYRWLALPVITLLAAVLAKEDAIALLPVLVLLAVLVRPVRDRRDLLELAKSLAPFMGFVFVYVAVQLSLVVGSDANSKYSFGWHGAPRLGQALRWMSLPWPSPYAPWVDPAQWAVFSFFIAAAVFAALRRQWLVPALYGATTLVLLPSSFLTSPFAPRWTYLATLPWAAFIAVLLTFGYRWTSAWGKTVGGVAAAAIAVALLVLLSQRTVDSQFWVPRVTDEYKLIQATATEGCPGTEGRQVFVFELAVPDPGYAVPSMLRLYGVSESVRQLTPRVFAKAPPPRAGDCVLYWNRSAGYQTATVPLERQGFAFWAPPLNPNLLGTLDTWLPRQGSVSSSADGLLVSSNAGAYGASSGGVPATANTTYVASVWVKGVQLQPGDRVQIAIGDGTSRSTTNRAATFTLTDTWRRLTIYYPVGWEPGVVMLGVTHLVRRSDTPSSFLVRDAELKQFGLSLSPP